MAICARIAGSEMLGRGEVATTALQDFAFVPDVVEVLAPGAQSSLQELPGRLGLWHVGVPPSGPMDARSFGHANRLVGNHDRHRRAGTDGLGPDAAVSAPMSRWRWPGQECRCGWMAKPVAA